MKSLENYPYKNIPSISSIITLIKPITWFPPMWAFLCGAVSSSNISFDTSMLLLIGLILSEIKPTLISNRQFLELKMKFV